MGEPEAEITEHGERPEGVTELAMACIDMVGHTGAIATDIRYQDDQLPVVWMAVGQWNVEGHDVYQVGAAFTVENALCKLLEDVMDGGECTHCHRPVGFDANQPLYADMGDSGLVCWYFFNPDTKKIQGGCQLPDSSPIPLEKEKA
jgi:hypothetical protein